MQYSYCRLQLEEGATLPGPRPRQGVGQIVQQVKFNLEPIAWEIIAFCSVIGCCFSDVTSNLHIVELGLRVDWKRMASCFGVDLVLQYYIHNIIYNSR